MAAIETRGLCKVFGALTAVAEVDLTVEAGQVVGLVGPNGAGKTTLLRMLATLLPPTSGEGRVLGFDLRREYLDVRRQTGFLPDFFNLYNTLRLRECLDFFARVHGVPSAEIPARVDEALAYVALTEKADAMIEHLSRGMTQRLGVAALMVSDPMLFLLDEPASGLDPRARVQLRQVLKRLSQEGRTIVISSHILTELTDLCSHIAIMSRGRMQVFGTVNDIERRAGGVSRLELVVLNDAARAAELTGAFLDAPAQMETETLVTVQAPAEAERVAALNAHLVERGIRVAGLTRSKTDLEALFMAVSGEGE